MITVINEKNTNTNTNNNNSGGCKVGNLMIKQCITYIYGFVGNKESDSIYLASQ